MVNFYGPTLRELNTIDKQKKAILLWWDSLKHLMYPESCLSCSRELSIHEQGICSFCTEELAFTHYHLYEEATPMDKLFWGRTEIKGTYAHLHFKKKNPVQRILFHLKYKNGFQLGKYFGRQIGINLKAMKSFADAEVLIPVPLHYKRKFKRGYNQSDYIALGVAHGNPKLQMSSKLVDRSANTATQTRKNRFQRWDNVQGIFMVSPDIKKYKHVVLVDDVITTGSTLETLAQAIRHAHPEIHISIVTLAIA